VFADSSPQAGAVFDSVESGAQKELVVVAAMRQVIDVSWLDVTIGVAKRSLRQVIWLRSRKGARNLYARPLSSSSNGGILRLSNYFAWSDLMPLT
jgi:hypothetical protein